MGRRGPRPAAGSTGGVILPACGSCASPGIPAMLNAAKIYRAFFLRLIQGSFMIYRALLCVI